MAKHKKLYRELREAGLRKKSARRLSRLPKGRQATADQRQAIARLNRVVTDLESRTGMSDGERTAGEMLEVSDIRGVGVRD